MQNPKVVQVLEGYPDGAEIDVLAKEMRLTESQVRDRIGKARSKGKNIKRVDKRTFQLLCGEYRGRYQ